MKVYTPDQIEALVNWDGLLCKPPWRNAAERRQYYGRHISRLLWRTFTPDDWRQIAEVVDDLRVSPKLKRATKFLLQRRSQS